jgi:type VI secretion system secreted protein VgrG
MTTYAQADRSISVTTPLGPDRLLLTGFAGREAVSELFDFRLDLVAENATDVAFDKLLGQKLTVTVLLPGEKKRFFNGVCNRVSQGARDTVFTHYQAEIVPQFWLLTKRAQSRIFQHINVPEILKRVLAGLDVAFEIQGTFHPRDYCVQYRESDFHFASRLMEEEGIYYFFKHSERGHQMVVANRPQSHPDLAPASKLIYDDDTGGVRDEERVYSWEKVQELRSGKYTLWDHCFEMPPKHLEAEQPIQDSSAAGEVTHKLKVGGNDSLEVYDYPGGYAQRFDGVDRAGGDRAGDLQKIFEDNRRTVRIRMEEEAAGGLVVRGRSNCRHLVSGHEFTLERHFNADGKYVLTGVEHSATFTSADYRSGEGEFRYENAFTCLPAGLPFRPERRTPRPFVKGTQTAVVVGPAGEEIFTDKYGRVKVQFHWDREGQADADSSCWVRVAQHWAGKRWGAMFIPRIGHEVVVDFLEGDPDQPIIVGSVYNAENMPHYKLPDHRTMSGVKSSSSTGGKGFNEIRFEDKKGGEQLFVHAEKDQDIRIKNDRREWVGNNRHLIVNHSKYEEVVGEEHSLVKQHRYEEVKKEHHLTVGGNEMLKVEGSQSLTVGQDVHTKAGMNINAEAGMIVHVKAGMTLVLEAGMQLSLKVGGNFIDINPAGIFIQGMMVNINSGGAPGVGPGAQPVAPTAPKETEIADKAEPGSVSETYRAQRAAMTPEQQAAANAPLHDPESEENKEKKHWIEIELVDKKNNPIPGEEYRITLPDGTTLATGTLDHRGRARVESIDPGTCKVTFPKLDKKSWKPK